MDFVICGESTVTLKKHNPDPSASAENDDVGGRWNTGADDDLSQFNRGGDVMQSNAGQLWRRTIQS